MTIHVPYWKQNPYPIGHSCRSVAPGLKIFGWTTRELQWHLLGKLCIYCAHKRALVLFICKFCETIRIIKFCRHFTTDIASLLPQTFSGTRYRPRKIKYVKLTSRSRVAIFTFKQTALIHFAGVGDCFSKTIRGK